MRMKVGPVVWFILGGLAAFSFIGAAGIGAIFVLPVLFASLVLLALRLPGIWLLLAGAGTVGGILWTVHIASGDTPDDELWPVFIAAALVVIGFDRWRRQPDLPATAPSRASSPADR